MSRKCCCRTRRLYLQNKYSGYWGKSCLRILRASAWSVSTKKQESRLNEFTPKNHIKREMLFKNAPEREKHTVEWNIGGGEGNLLGTLWWPSSFVSQNTKKKQQHNLCIFSKVQNSKIGILNNNFQATSSHCFSSRLHNAMNEIHPRREIPR